MKAIFKTINKSNKDKRKDVSPSKGCVGLFFQKDVTDHFSTKYPESIPIQSHLYFLKT